KEVEITLVVDEPVTVELTIEYLVTGASWTPEYNARLDRDSSIHFEYFAFVIQQTGEPWPELPLTLSTASLSENPYLPQIEVWRIDKQNFDNIRPGARQQEQEVRSAMDVTHTVRIPPPAQITEGEEKKLHDEQLRLAKMQTESSEVNVEYRSERPLEIPSD